jgi:hypothetical protein
MMQVLDGLTASEDRNWGKDLLSAWAPSGTPATSRRTLRLAVRDNYLNFYRSGQSVARVSIDRAGNPLLTTHVKYHFEDRAKLPQAYLVVVGDRLRYPAAVSPGVEMHYTSALLERWTARSLSHRGTEKPGVEEVVARHPSVIDLEMGLPAWPGQTNQLAQPTKVAPRMDLVALERGPAGPTVVFWEAKTIGDSRLRSREPGNAEVLWQMLQYASYLHDDERYQSVATAYRNVCQLLVRFHAMAASLPSADAIAPLDGLVQAVAEADTAPAVDRAPRLFIFHGVSEGRKERAPSSWAEQRKALSDLRIVYSEDAEGIRL